MGCFGGESEKTKLKRAKQRAKVEKERAIAEENRRRAQPWNDERQLNALSKRTRTHPGTNTIPYIGPQQMRPRTEAQNTYYVSKERTDYVGQDARHRHITHAEVLRDLARGPPPGQPAGPNVRYPTVYRNDEEAFTVRPIGYYHEYPVHGSGESKHTRGADFSFAKKVKPGPWRAITDSNQQFEGVLIHNRDQAPDRNGFHKPDVYYIGARPSDAQVQPGRFHQPGRSKTQANGFEEPFVRSRR